MIPTLSSEVKLAVTATLLCTLLVATLAAALMTN